MGTSKILVGNVLNRIADIKDETVQCCVTSPQYWGLRDYGHDGQLGLEPTPDAYVENMVAVFREVWRVLKDDGVLWLNLGDSYAMSSMRGENSAFSSTTVVQTAAIKGAVKLGKRSIPPGLKPKDLVGIPWRVAFALQADGWYLRQDIIWHKPNPMPESVTDRAPKPTNTCSCSPKTSGIISTIKPSQNQQNTPATTEGQEQTPAEEQT